MARLGINPARGKTSAYRPAQVTVAILTYIPHLDGYFQHKLEILKVVFASLRRHTIIPFDLFVFDNGSCQPVINYLRQRQEAGEIDYLLLSDKNIGKIEALKLLFNAVPGEIIAYSDDDIFFYPGWLEAHLHILENFPEVGMVSGVPVRNAAGHALQSIEKLVEFGAPGLSYSCEHRIPDEWEADWALSTGRDPQAHLQATRSHLDILLKTEKAEAIAASNHFQFVCTKSVIVQALPEDWSGKLMGHMIQLDEAVDSLGYLRLSTTNRFTRHLGNLLSPELKREIRAFGISVEGEGHIRLRTGRHWLLSIPGSRRLLRAVYNRLFQILHRID